MMRKIPQLPEEITEEILVRLQVRDLLRFKSVCKLWYRMISSTRFIRLHLDKSKPNPSHHRILSPYNKSFMKTIDCSDLYNRELVIRDLPMPRKTALIFLGTCDGLVCYYNKRKKSICVWNPAMRMRKRLHKFEISDSDGLLFCWFGHESDGDSEYKLVIGLPSTYAKGVIHVINPYAAEEDTGWKSTHEIAQDYLLFGFGTLLNRKLHWAAWHLIGGAFLIFSFDLRDKTIVEIPGHKATVMLESATLFVMNGCLCTVHRTLFEHKVPIFEVWMMKEYGVKESWTKLSRILSDIVVWPRLNGHFPSLCVVGVTDKGYLIVKVENTELLISNIAESKSRTLMTKREGREVMYVVESLVFPSGVPIVGSLAK